jgi:NAD dependent epimerase/dehydratase family enzyme
LFWDPKKYQFDDIKSLEGVDAIVHLAGENVAGKNVFDARWTRQRKEDILNSRVDGTKLIVDAISKLKNKPKVFVSASATGFYGFQDSNTVFDESDKSGDGFIF